MDYVILGLLLLSSRTIYQIRDRIGKGMHLMFSSSMGSIQAAIKKLMTSGYIGFEERVENGKYKKYYSITDSGKESFLQWVNAPLDAQFGRFPELSKVYFMGFAQQENRVAALEKHLEQLKEQYTVLCMVCDGTKDVDVPEEFREVFDYQYATAEYGRDTIKFNIDWFDKFLNKIKDDKK